LLQVSAGKELALLLKNLHLQTKACFRLLPASSLWYVSRLFTSPPAEATMTARLIDGKEIAREMRQQIRREIDSRSEQGFRQPGLAVILVGSDPASQIYVRNKRRACGID
jgi:hypothetical protein